MKHIKIVFSIIFILCLILFAKKVYGYNQMVIPDGGLLIEQEELSKEKQRVIDASSEYYSYGDMYATAKFKVTKKKDKSGNIVYLLGEGSNAIEWKQAGNMIFDDNENSNKEGTWEVWLDIYYELNISTENKYDVKAQNCYSAKEGDFDPKKDGWQGQRVLDSVVKTVADGVGAVVDAGKNVVNTVKGADEGLNELSKIFNSIDKFENSHFIFVDNYPSYRKITKENWYDNAIDKENCIWVGQGIELQNVISINKLSKSDINDVANGTLFRISNGNYQVVKGLDNPNEGGLFYQ